MIIEKTTQEEWTKKNNFDDNYNLLYYYSCIIYYISIFQFWTYFVRDHGRRWVGRGGRGVGGGRGGGGGVAHAFSAMNFFVVL